MPSWLTSLLFALLVVTIPFSLLLKIMLQLPKPVALSHRRWPLFLTIGLIGAITAYVTIFIRSAYYGSADPLAVLMQFVIAALAYTFGLVLLLRQYTGVYPEFIVTTGGTGLVIRKTVYRNIRDVEQLPSRHGETRLIVETTHGHILSLTLPTREVPVFYERLRR
jgi:fluoride ion exporter CrcB/FEX